MLPWWHSLDFISNASMFCNWAVAAFGLAALVLSQREGTLEGKQTAERDQKLADTKLAAGKANERAAGLEKEAAQAKLELARIDPTNLPIKSLRADVYLVIEGSFSEPVAKLSDDNAKGAFSVSLRGRQGSLCSLICTDLTRHLTMKTEPDGAGGLREVLTGQMISATFHWPAADWITLHKVVKSWIERTNASATALDKELGGLSLILPLGDSSDAKVVQGSCRMTINGVLQRDFLVPPSTNGRELRFSPNREP